RHAERDATARFEETLRFRFRCVRGVREVERRPGRGTFGEGFLAVHRDEIFDAERSRHCWRDQGGEHDPADQRQQPVPSLRPHTDLPLETDTPTSTPHDSKHTAKVAASRSY